MEQGGAAEAGKDICYEGCAFQMLVSPCNRQRQTNKTQWRYLAFLSLSTVYIIPTRYTARFKSLIELYSFLDSLGAGGSGMAGGSAGKDDKKVAENLKNCIMNENFYIISVPL